MNISSEKKPHIVIDPFDGKYMLLDDNYEMVGYPIYSNPILNFFTKKFKMLKFRGKLNADLKAYKTYCANNHRGKNYQFLKINKLIKRYLWLCPDADYNILELLRNNYIKANPDYCNYQLACAEYLYELCHFTSSNKHRIPFDINYACTKDSLLVNPNHRALAYFFGKTNTPIETYKQIKEREENEENDSFPYKISVVLSSPLQKNFPAAKGAVTQQYENENVSR